MNDQSKRKKLGQGMKPRNQQVNGESEPEEQNTLSDSEGQLENAEEGVYEPPEVIEGGTTLDSNQGESTVTDYGCTMELKDSQKSCEQHIRDNPELPSEYPFAIQSLANILAQSADENGEKHADSATVQCCERDDNDDGNCDIHSAPGVFRNRQFNGDGQCIVTSIPQKEAQEFLRKIQGTSTPPIGPRPDGTYGAVVTVPEGYWEPICEQAASDGITPYEWLSIRVQEIMETWWAPPQSR